MLRVVFDWRERRRAFRELARFQRDEHARLSLDDGNPVNRAKVALKAGDLVAANKFWDIAMEKYPAFAKWHNDALPILIGLQRFDEAERLALEGERTTRKAQSYAETYAAIAQARGEIGTAVQRWSRVRRKYSQSSKAYVQGIGCLIRAGDADAAEELARAAIQHFPNVDATWMESARVAELRQDWPQALRRWELAKTKFTHTIIEIGIARVLMELGRLEEADERLLQARRRDPLWPEIASQRVRVARLMGDEREEMLRWVDARRRFPLLPFGYREGFRRLLDWGRIAEAEEVLLAAIDRFPTEPWPAEEYAEIASQKQDWAAAEVRWAAVRERWSDREKGYTRGAEALIALGRSDEAAQLKARRRHA
jgi:tetratricopeptide (TPR) repeat protein